MHQGGGLEGMVGTLPPHVAAGEGAELVVDQDHEVRFRVGVATPDGGEQAGDFAS
jgi:hypothetical protein